MQASICFKSSLMNCLLSANCLLLLSVHKYTIANPPAIDNSIMACNERIKSPSASFRSIVTLPLLSLTTAPRASFSFPWRKSFLIDSVFVKVRKIELTSSFFLFFFLYSTWSILIWDFCTYWCSFSKIKRQFNKLELLTSFLSFFSLDPFPLLELPRGCFCELEAVLKKPSGMWGWRAVGVDRLQQAIHPMECINRTGREKGREGKAKERNSQLGNRWLLSAVLQRRAGRGLAHSSCSLAALFEMLKKSWWKRRVFFAEFPTFLNNNN